jgi:hypothetical protein
VKILRLHLLEGKPISEVCEMRIPAHIGHLFRS